MDRKYQVTQWLQNLREGVSSVICRHPRNRVKHEVRFLLKIYEPHPPPLVPSVCSGFSMTSLRDSTTALFLLCLDFLNVSCDLYTCTCLYCLYLFDAYTCDLCKPIVHSRFGFDKEENCAHLSSLNNTCFEVLFMVVFSWILLSRLEFFMVLNADCSAVQNNDFLIADFQ